MTVSVCQKSISLSVLVFRFGEERIGLTESGLVSGSCSRRRLHKQVRKGGCVLRGHYEDYLEMPAYAWRCTYVEEDGG